MKQKIFEALKARFDGVNENILSRIAEKLAKTVTAEDAVQAAVDAVTFQQVIDSEGDRRATDASQTAITNYEKKYSVREGKPVTGGGQGTQTEPANDDKGNGSGTGAEMPAWAKTLVDSNRALAEKITGLEKDKLSGSRKQKLSAIIEKLPESLRKPYGRINLTDMTDEEFEAFLTETTGEVEAAVNDLEVKGSVVGFPKGGNSTVSKKEPTGEDVDNVLNGII